MNRKMLPLLVGVAAIAVGLLLPYLLTSSFPSLSHLQKLGVVWPAAKYLLSFVGVWITYHFSKCWIPVSRVGDTWQSELKHYLIAIACCAFIASASAFYLGTHREDGDPVFGGGEIVVDYEPTDDQRVRHGLIFFLCLCVPALYGVHSGLVELRHKRKQTAQITAHAE